MEEAETTGEIVHNGDSAISLMDNAVKDTWVNRGWIGENETLNQTTASRIVKNYKDKFQIENNVKVEFVDGLKNKDGLTSATSFLGKNKGKIKDITIKIDKNAKNPYAVLRSELEHARDLAKGEVPDQTKKHFSRYEGKNEAEVAPFYVQKKAKSALERGQTATLQGAIDKYEKEGFSYKAEKPSQLDPANKLYLEKEGRRLGNLSYYVDEENCLHIEHVVNETHPAVDYTLQHFGRHEQGVADRLIEKAIIDNPNVNYIIWDTADTAHARRLLEGFKRRHAALAKKIVSSEEYEKLAQSQKGIYTGEKGGINDTGRDTGEVDRGSARRLLGADIPDNTKTPIGNSAQEGQRVSSISRNVDEGNRGTVTGRSNPDIDGIFPDGNSLQGIQDKTLAPKSLDEVVNNITTGKTVLKTQGDIDRVVDEATQLQPEISGFTFENIKQDSEMFGVKVSELLEQNADIYNKLFLQGDTKMCDILLRKQLAAYSVILNLVQDLANGWVAWFHGALLVCRGSKPPRCSLGFPSGSILRLAQKPAVFVSFG